MYFQSVEANGNNHAEKEKNSASSNERNSILRQFRLRLISRYLDAIGLWWIIFEQVFKVDYSFLNFLYTIRTSQP